MRNKLNSATFELKKSSIREFANLAKETKGCISLTLGEPDFDSPQVVINCACDSLNNHETHYIANAGIESLRRKIADYEKERHGFSCDSEEIIVTAGATEALFVSLISIVEPGDEVIIPTPAFVLYEQIIRLCRGIPVFLDTSLDNFQINRDRLQSLINEKTKAIVINTPNNPTGVVLNHDSLETLHDVVKGNDIFVVADDVYREIVYTKNYYSMAGYLDIKNKVILVQSFSKTYAMTGWRMGYLIADNSIIDRMQLVHQFVMASTPAPFQKACLEALDFNPTEMLKVYSERRKIVTESLIQMGLEFVCPEGAFYVFPSINELGMTSDVFCRRLIKEGKVAVTPGFCFGKEGYIRISYCVNEKDLKEGLKRLSEFVEKCRNERS